MACMCVAKNRLGDSPALDALGGQAMSTATLLLLLSQKEESCEARRVLRKSAARLLDLVTCVCSVGMAQIRKCRVKMPT